jgi:hypothetical protein
MFVTMEKKNSFYKKITQPFTSKSGSESGSET